MGWFNRRKIRTPGQVGPSALQTGLYRAPGFAMLCRELELEPPRSILDLGQPSTENVEFLSGFTPNVTIQDFYRGCRRELVPVAPSREHRVGRQRGVNGLSRIVGSGVGNLPDEEHGFDVVLLWDLIHYFDREELPEMVEGLRALARPGCWLHLYAAAKARIPAQPIWFKVERPDRLLYTIESDARVETRGWVTRDVERLLAGFTPRRLYQLRNGLQELLLVRA